jgi:protein SMG6
MHVPAVKVVKKCHAVSAFHEEDSEEKCMGMDDEGDPQASPALSDAHTPVELPVSFKLAMELAFSMLSFVLRNPTWKASPFARSTLNPYLSVMLTFLATLPHNHFCHHHSLLKIHQRLHPQHRHP